MLIGELAAASGTTAKTVRLYEAKALLTPAVVRFHRHAAERYAPT